MQNNHFPAQTASVSAPVPGVPLAAPAFYPLVNTLLTLFLVGAVIVISNNLTAIPVAAFIGLFGLLTVLTLALTLQALNKRRMGWARTWAYWGCVFFGIAAVATAHRLGWLAFIPDLILVWLIVFAASALALRHSVNLLVAELLLTLWLVCTFLYGQSYLPGLAVCLLLSWHLLVRQPQGALLLWHTANALVLACFYVYTALQPQHYPLQWQPTLVVPLLAMLAWLWCASHAALEIYPERRDLRLLGRALSAVAFVLPLLLSVAPLWQVLQANWSGQASRFALLLSCLCWLLGMATLRRTAAPKSLWTGMGFWIAGAVLLELVRHFADTPYAQQFSWLAAALAAALAWRRMQRAAAKQSLPQLLGASLLLVLVLCAALFSRELPYAVPVLALWALALLIAWQLRQLSRSSPQPTPASQPEQALAAAQPVLQGRAA